MDDVIKRTMIQGDKGKTSENAIPTMTQESNEKSSAVQQKEINPIEINGQFDIYSVAFLVNEKHVVSGDDEGKIRRWRVEDGEEVGMLMDAGNHILSIAVSRDGKWIVSGTKNGLVTVWNAEWQKSDRVYRTHGLCACGGRLFGWDENRDGFGRQDCLRLVALDWQATTRAIETRQILGGRCEIFTRRMSRCNCYIEVCSGLRERPPPHRRQLYLCQISMGQTSCLGQRCQTTLCLILWQHSLSRRVHWDHALEMARSQQRECQCPMHCAGEQQHVHCSLRWFVGLVLEHHDAQSNRVCHRVHS